MRFIYARASTQAGRTALHFAKRGGHKDIVLLLDDGYTAMADDGWNASRIEHVLDDRSDFARPLLDDGVDMEADNKHGRTALTWAAPEPLLQSRCCCSFC